jgi:energy-coupling factor transport system ATP-binding protein
MDKALSFKDVTFSYRKQKTPALHDISLDIPTGSFVGIAGHTGAGKSTLLRLAMGIVPNFYKGRLLGTVHVNGQNIRKQSVASMAGIIGALFQDFESQLFSTNATLEMAFGMQNLGIERDEMIRRIDRISRLVGLSDYLEREPQSLSGGQKQRLALGSILCMDPNILLCDEPTTDLDPVGKRDILDALEKLKDKGRTILLAEHDGERLLGLDRILLMNQGKIAADGTPEQVFGDLEYCKSIGVLPPQMFELFSKLGLDERPRTVSQASRLLEQHGFRANPDADEAPKIPSQASPLLELDEVQFSYTPDAPILKNVSLSVSQGDFVALLGQNGSGKTTLAKQINALLFPGKGQVRFQGKSVAEIGTTKMGRHVGFVFQNPDHMLFEARVFDEVAFGLRNQKMDEKQVVDCVEDALTTVGLSGKEEIDPFILTKGERQKLAVASVLACRPQVLILDEPTTGLDATEQVAMMDLLKQLNGQGHTVIFITHSLEIAAAYANRVVLMDQGQILADGPAIDLFFRFDLLEKTSLIAPPVVRLAKELGTRALTVDGLAKRLIREAT